MKESIKRMKEGYVRFVEKQGFPIIVAACIIVIASTALFTRDSSAAYISPTPPVMEHVSAAQLLQQSLASMPTATPAPTKAPLHWASPVETIQVLRPFDAIRMEQGESGVWSVHDAVDLKDASGAKVYAIADGTIIAADSDKLHGAWITIDHGNGYEAHYAGMALLCDYIPGDEVRMGDTIGFVGNSMLDETSLGPHLHLRITKGGEAIDPCSLWENLSR